VGVAVRLLPQQNPRTKRWKLLTCTRRHTALSSASGPYKSGGWIVAPWRTGALAHKTSWQFTEGWTVPLLSIKSRAVGRAIATGGQAQLHRN